jgi:hypothetical protein
VVADAVHRQHRLVGQHAADELLPGHVLVREHRPDARHRDRRARVDAANARRGMRAAQRRAEEHPVPVQV